jgi:hypothetical protein
MLQHPSAAAPRRAFAAAQAQTVKPRPSTRSQPDGAGRHQPAEQLAYVADIANQKNWAGGPKFAIAA